MAHKIKREDLEYLLEQIFDANWQTQYELDHNSLGYALYIKEERGGVALFSSESRRLSASEMYYYLRGMLDMKDLRNYGTENLQNGIILNQVNF
ncbi:MAG: hypothetical protein LBC68_05490 [Prevotellaceae bacterium]|jgi:hypothetical protein|nr:hypothetical protein [Prevotellaceae bacterium]